MLDIGVDTLYNLPALPGVYSFQQSGVLGLINVKLGSVHGISDEEVKETILSTVQRLPIPHKEPSNPEFEAYSSHTPFEPVVPASATAAELYKEPYGLQRQRHTYYTGATFNMHSSPPLWQFAEALLPNITAA